MRDFNLLRFGLHLVPASVWKKDGKFCADSLFLYDGGIYREYYCEFDEYVKSQYSIKVDTLILIEYRLSSEVVANKPIPIPTYVWKYLFHNSGTMDEIYYENVIYKVKSFNRRTSRYSKVK